MKTFLIVLGSMALGTLIGAGGLYLAMWWVFSSISFL